MSLGEIEGSDEYFRDQENNPEKDFVVQWLGSFCHGAICL